ncbi:dynein axonemal assembly factor 4 isoform X2 [Takifugu rubripes]|uniref:dynein axonemal assembly factor 4 isoform X2 n=1 Tax=Takifugu rubripes TaxID=31033 RepID=UPI0011461139|nr:dynein assembly factor 4, axonemal isoform X2 [Takifugu rubripes]
MPLNFSNWSWTQSESTVYVTLPLRGAAAGKVDIVLTQDYLKVHHPPYLFEAFLLQPIDDVGSSARVTDSAVFLRLLKRTPEPWEGLLTHAGEEATKRLREKALLSYQEKLRSESRLRAESSRADSKYALKTMMKLEEKQQARIKELKETEQERVSAELRAWQQKPEEPAGKRPEDRRGRKLQSCLEPPAPRAPGRIGVTFTPRVFPTALRESRVAQEEEWLRRQAEARQVEAADDAELKELEEPQRNPAWLKDKGELCICWLRPLTPTQQRGPERTPGEERPSASCSSTQKACRTTRQPWPSHLPTRRYKRTCRRSETPFKALLTSPTPPSWTPKSCFRGRRPAGTSYRTFQTATAGLGGEALSLSTVHGSFPGGSWVPRSSRPYT